MTSLSEIVSGRRREHRPQFIATAAIWDKTKIHSTRDIAYYYRAYIETGRSGNLLISRGHLMDRYKIIGFCIYERIENEGSWKSVKIR